MRSFSRKYSTCIYLVKLASKYCNCSLFADMGNKENLHVGRTKDLEFGGFPGSIGMVAGLPVGVYYLNLICNKVSYTVYRFILATVKYSDSKPFRQVACVIK